MDQSKLLELQLQMRRNNEELQSFISGLDSWETDIKKKDDELKESKSSAAEDETSSKLPPIRNSLLKKKKKKKTKPKSEEDDQKKSKRLSGYDFRAWDKYNVDEALKEIDGQEEQSHSSEYETDEEWEMERRVQQANVLKEQGNQAFKEQKYDEATELYTRAMECDSTNAVLPANRAMALLKQSRFGAAQVDCTMSIALDPTYIKAYSRRGTARVGLNLLEEARCDFQKVIVLDPKNKHAVAEIKKIDKKLEEQAAEARKVEQHGIVEAIYKPPDKRSKKPLRRIEIEEIGVDSGEAIKKAIGVTESKQSEAKRRVTEKDAAMFEHFVSEVPAKCADSPQDETSPTTATSQPSKTDVEKANSPGQKSEASATSTETNLLAKAGVQEVNSKDQKAQGGRAKQAAETEATTKAYQPPKCIVEDVSSRGQETVQVRAKQPPNSGAISDVPATPTTSYQFQTDWKALRNNHERFFHYFKSIDPTQYVKLFGQALDADILTAILVILKEFYLPGHMDIYPVLANVAMVKRFSMTVMFMSSNEKRVLHTLFDSLRSSEGHTSEEIDQLAKKYEL